jgi:hypothetical protein
MKTYVIKIALRDVSPMIWRRIHIPGTTSLATLHYVIQSLFGWHNNHLHQFHIYGKDYGIFYDGGIAFDDNPHKVYFDKFEFDAGDKFTYEYNFFKHLIHDIRVEKVQETTEPFVSVRCLRGAGMPGKTKYDECALYAKLVDTLARIPGTTLADRQPILDRLNKIMKKFELVKFNCKKLNLRLAEISV